jgi:hypothetical protein
MEVFFQMLGFFEIFGHMLLKCYISKFEYFEHGVPFSQLGKMPSQHYYVWGP